ncbi:sarcosine oxidase subunit beta family protein [Roseospirillum parvum]|uniref:Sarcosine oxidase subunit beta n=1 Tax=Roseospirillum parvum TaxID=83401 RepID=A0A1G7XU11_9PROT|nr:sarcosine oxidase subunit beta family protein [Roseospirillum parvum]SDG87692.1 sarcosine oxidase subunit beta [Roseospirillum parvum]
MAQRATNLFSLARQALSHHRNWPRLWAAAEPRRHYQAIIIGAGGHGLATAYYLVREHGLSDVAVIERGWVGGGNTGRNTTIVRSNYLWDESAHLYEHSLKLWEGLTRELDYNVMFSQRGVLNLAHTVHDVREAKRRVNANRLNGIDAEFLDRDGVKAVCPGLDVSPTRRFPILGATWQKRGGVARHDAVAWGFARAASRLGVDVIENCPVEGFLIDNGVCKGVRTGKGEITADKVGIVVAGQSSVLAGMAGFRLPVTSHPLQAMVSEPIKPVVPCVVMSGQVHAYVSQSDKGELVLGAGIDRRNGYGQRGSFPVLEQEAAALLELFPAFSRLRLMRSWGGTVDTCPDASPIIGRTPIDNLFINCGWGTGGFKSTPGSGWVFAHTLATGQPHPLNAPFSLDRFTSGALIDEHGAAGVAH